MSIFQAFIMGLVQGATEFLPVSSSGHLALMARICEIHNSIVFDLILHSASALSIVVVFWKDIWAIIKKPFGKIAISLVISTALSGLVVLLLKDFVEGFFDGKYLPLFFMLTAVLLTFGAKNNNRMQNSVTFIDSAIVGIAQGIAVFPGLSRSGVTTTTLSLLGVKREQAASYSFIMSLPLILGSVLLSIGESNAISISFPALLVGFTTAFISGLIALKVFKKLFVKNNAKPFVIYLILLSSVILVNDLFLHIF
jgi:undecaprenyl-diphosphatase